MPLITRVRKKEPEAEPEVLEKVGQRFKVRWIIDSKGEDRDGIIDHKALVVEDPPRRVTVFCQYDAEYVVSKPWSYMIGHFTPEGGYLKSSIFFSYKQLESPSEKSLLLVPLSNITYTRLSYVSPCVCLGRHSVTGTSLESRAIHLNELFWASRFNNEIIVGAYARPTWAEKFTRIKPLLAKWQSKSTPNRRTRIEFCKADKSMSSINAAVRWLRRYVSKIY